VALMVAYLVQNDSRFGFSHEFVYCNTSAFKQAAAGNTVLGSVIGDIFVKRSEANYTMRPGVLELQSLYDFLSNFTVSRLKPHSFRFTNEKHPSSKSFLHGVIPAKNKKIPIVNHLNFCNAKHFEGHDIQACPLDGPDAPCDQILQAIDAYACQILLLFRPFRQIEDIQVQGSYLRKLRSIQAEVLTPEVLDLLQNVQDCQNALLLAGGQKTRLSSIRLLSRSMVPDQLPEKVTTMMTQLKETTVLMTCVTTSWKTHLWLQPIGNRCTSALV
jgi:hypothetical protein